jgi:hypothetical protein
MDSTHSSLKVPMLSTSAPARAVISSTSPAACAITGEAPIASSALAVKFITTRLVMLWTSGRLSRSAERSRAARAA